MELEGESLCVYIVHDQVENLVELRVFVVPDCFRPLAAILPNPDFNIRVHFAEQVTPRRNAVYL